MSKLKGPCPSCGASIEGFEGAMVACANCGGINPIPLVPVPPMITQRLRQRLESVRSSGTAVPFDATGNQVGPAVPTTELLAHLSGVPPGFVEHLVLDGNATQEILTLAQAKGVRSITATGRASSLGRGSSHVDVVVPEPPPPQPTLWAIYWKTALPLLLLMGALAAVFGTLGELPLAEIVAYSIGAAAAMAVVLVPGVYISMRPTIRRIPMAGPGALDMAIRYATSPRMKYRVLSMDPIAATLLPMVGVKVPLHMQLEGDALVISGPRYILRHIGRRLERLQR